MYRILSFGYNTILSSSYGSLLSIEKIRIYIYKLRFMRCLNTNSFGLSTLHVKIIIFVKRNTTFTIEMVSMIKIQCMFLKIKIYKYIESSILFVYWTVLNTIIQATIIKGQPISDVRQFYFVSYENNFRRRYFIIWNSYTVCKIVWNIFLFI